MDRLAGRLAGATVALAVSGGLAACGTWLWHLALSATTDAAITFGVLGGVWSLALAAGGVVTAILLALRRHDRHPSPPVRLVPLDRTPAPAGTGDLEARQPA